MAKVAKKKMSSTRRKRQIVPPSSFEVILMYIFRLLKQFVAYYGKVLKAIQARRLAKKIKEFNDE